VLSLWIAAASSLYKIGIGIADVTGPAAGVTFVSIILILIFYDRFYIVTYRKILFDLNKTNYPVAILAPTIEAILKVTLLTRKTVVYSNKSF